LMGFVFIYLVLRAAMRAGRILPERAA